LVSVGVIFLSCFIFFSFELDEVEQQHFGAAALLDGDLVVTARELHRISRAQRLAVHLRFAANDMQVDAPAGPRFGNSRCAVASRQ